MLEVKNVVEQGYNKIANDYYTHRDLNKFNTELESFSKLLPSNGKVLDVGAGAGIPTAKYLVNRGFDVTGIDISETMINLAKKNVPSANFIKMDINNITLPINSFDGLVSVYTLFHIPRDNHQKIFNNFNELLKPNGLMMINIGVSESEGFSNFFGVRMFWSNYSPKKTLDFVKKAGFSILFEGILIRGGEHQYWIFAKKTNK
ncbi:MAG: methyltransferase domain-containing protein [Candidatus Lokiarchaeota archaeon]|nr:methyltransferase domain-containing protein [Candidatus Lokiarchaeota archaeon]MBD3202124.1 methyltransferase domain-containing protein [Candidatus Lokiarchaeota archaeon]